MVKQDINKFDLALTNWVVTTFGQSTRPFFELMTLLGGPAPVCVIAAGVVGYGLTQHNMRLAISGAIIPLTLIVGTVLKMIFERARPMTEYALNMKIHTFSFPSGHSTGSTVAYGLLAYLAFIKLPAPWNYIAAIVLGLIPFFVGISRVYLGAHFPTDVVAGWILGLVALSVIILVIRPIL
jgi:undecaprenyl-diphosphatase